jgi:hypothetical protein
MRPSPEELLASLRVSLNDVILPNVADRWARYMGTAMDLMLQHLQLRLAGELDAITEDSRDMSEVIAAIAATASAAGQRASGTERGRWESLLDLLAAGPAAAAADDRLADATQVNEALRAQVVDLLRWLDTSDDSGLGPAGQDTVRAISDDLHRLIRRQVDRTQPLVKPLFMSFGPTVPS